MNEASKVKDFKYIWEGIDDSRCRSWYEIHFKSVEDGEVFWAFKSEVVRGRDVTTGDELSGLKFSVKDKKAYDVFICTGSYSETLDLELDCEEDDDNYWSTSYNNKLVSKF